MRSLDRRAAGLSAQVELLSNHTADATQTRRVRIYDSIHRKARLTCGVRAVTFPFVTSNYRTLTARDRGGGSEVRTGPLNRTAAPDTPTRHRRETRTGRREEQAASCRGTRGSRSPTSTPPSLSTSGGCTAVTRSPLFPVRRRGPNTQIKPIRRGEEPLRREEPEHPIPGEIRAAFACPACNPTMQQAPQRYPSE